MNAPLPPADDAVIDMRRMLVAAFAKAPGVSADELGAIFEESIRREYGGDQVYIGKGLHFRVEKMRQAVRERWNGTNTDQLAREFEVTPRRIYQLATELRGREQLDMFAAPTAPPPHP